jgi:hypothetical protein
MNLKKIPTTRLMLYLLSGLLFLFLLISFLIRGMILHKAISSIDARMNNQYAISEIYLKNRNGRNIIAIDSLSLRARIVPLFFKRIRLRKLDCNTISIHYQTADSIPQTAIKKQIDTVEIFDKIRTIDLAEFINQNLRRLFSYIPSRTMINHLIIRIIYSRNTTLLSLHDLRLIHGSLNAGLQLTGNNYSIDIPVMGKLDKSASVIEVHMTNKDPRVLPVPVLKDRYGVMAGFNTLSFVMNLSKRNRNLVNIEGIFSFSGLVLNGERISTSDIKIDNFRSSFLLHIASHFVELDSITRVDINKIQLLPFIRLDLAEDPTITFKLLPVSWEARDFFTSLPQGMFTSLIDFRAEGTMKYFLNFNVNYHNPDSLYFDTRLIAQDFKILHYGTDDFRILNSSFYYQVFEHGQLKTAFIIGPENPDFVPYDQISPFLRAAVMTSEDGSFFYHNGFNPGAFRESIITNIKEKRFARGGSTISMQLVKNVFLSRNKTLARKIEEALIVWLIESQNLVSKQRMYEVYLNIIEWGPGIYGINQASRFYFDKKPSEVNMEESIYLASIVPNPKWFKYTFETNGKPKLFFINYFKRLKELMVNKEFIEPVDTVGVLPSVFLKGPAALELSVAGTTDADSMRIKEFEFIPQMIQLKLVE